MLLLETHSAEELSIVRWQIFYTSMLSFSLSLSFVVYHINKDGWVKVSQTNVADLHYQYQDEKQQEQEL